MITYPEELEIFAIRVWDASDVFQPVENNLGSVIFVTVVKAPSICTRSLLIQVLKEQLS